MEERINHCGVDFVLIRRKVKNINLRVTHKGEVRVSAPVNMNIKTILEFVASKKQWIERHSEKKRPSENCFFYLGEEMPLSAIDNPDIFYEENCVAYLQNRFKNIGNTMGITPMPKLIIKALKGKYGYYTKKEHTVCLNDKIVMLPPECIDYIITHELLHTVYFNHGADFHTAVKRFIPNEKTLRNALSQYILW